MQLWNVRVAPPLGQVKCIDDRTPKTNTRTLQNERELSVKDDTLKRTITRLHGTDSARLSCTASFHRTSTTKNPNENPFLDANPPSFFFSFPVSLTFLLFSLFSSTLQTKFSKKPPLTRKTWVLDTPANARSTPATVWHGWSGRSNSPIIASKHGSQVLSPARQWGDKSRICQACSASGFSAAPAACYNSTSASGTSLTLSA